MPLWTVYFDGLYFQTSTNVDAAYCCGINYFFLKRLGQSDEMAFGLDKSDVTVEHIPLVYQPVTNLELKREEYMQPML